jgi:CRISPR-associated protein (TIGR03984 family)
MTALKTGFRADPIESVACHAYLAWLLGQASGEQPDGATELAWALAHSDDGVTWGRFDTAAKIWRLGDQAAPQVSPPIRLETLQELRLFGPTCEVLIWRTAQGLRGRTLRDADASTDKGEDALAPLVEDRLVLGERVVASCAHDFTHVGDRTGAEQVLPILVTDKQLHAGQVKLQVRHHFELDAETGAARVTVTRLVDLSNRSDHGT